MILRHISSFESIRAWPPRRTLPIATLAAAALIVGIAISIDGPLRKAVNGVGGVLWIASAAVLAWRLARTRNWRRGGIAAFVMTLCLVLLTKPSDLAWAAGGFALAGFLLGLVVNERRWEWGAFLASIWLPVHLLVAVIRVVERAARGLPATVRTNPPPTAALVPFAMVVCALLGAGAVEWILGKQRLGHEERRRVEA